MLLTAQLQDLAFYFGRSKTFYFFILDLNGNFIYINPLLLEAIDPELKNLEGVSVFETVSPQWRKKVEQIITQCKSDQDSVFSVKYLVQWNGRAPFNCDWEFSAIVGSSGLIEQIQAVGVVDKDMISFARQALRISWQHLRNQAVILDYVTDMIITTDVNRKVTSWNKVAEQMTGIPEEDAKGKMIRDILDKDFSPYTAEEVYQIVMRDGIWKGEVIFYGLDEEKKYLLYTISTMHDENGEFSGIIGVGKDLTARRKMEVKLLESELFYRNLISCSPDGIVLTDSNGRITYVGPSVKKVLGFDEDQVIGNRVFDFVFPDDLGMAREGFFLEVAKSGRAHYVQARLIDVNGNWDWFVVRGHNLLDNPNVNAMVIYFTNDRKRKEAEDKLRDSERHFRELIYNLNAGIMIFSKDGDVVTANKKAQQIMGIPDSRMVGTHSSNPEWEVIDEYERPLPLDQHPPILAATTKTPVQDRIIGLRGPHHKEVLWIMVNADPTLDQHGNIEYVVTSFTDITEHRKLTRRLIDNEMQKQKQLTQAMIDGQEKERLEIGKELHDNISQHLTTTRLYMEVAREKSSGEIFDMLNLSHKGLSGIIHEIRQLSQSLVPPTLGDLGLVESVQDLCDSLATAHAFKIRFYRRHFDETHLPGNMKLMLFRIIQEQVNNIVRHANATQVRIRLKSDAENIFLIISDNGKGFDPHTCKKGLGLSNIFNRVSLFNGRMEIESAPKMGCILMVCVPVPSSEN